MNWVLTIGEIVGTVLGGVVMDTYGGVAMYRAAAAVVAATAVMYYCVAGAGSGSPPSAAKGLCLSRQAVPRAAAGA